MNKKNKVLLTSIGLALFSGIAATSTTFAWFSTVQNASVSFSNATVTTEDNSLAIEYVSSRNDLSHSETVSNDLELSGLNKITDVSSEGLTFLKPEWTPSNPSVAYEINEVGASDADGFYIDFTINISRTEVGTNGMKVYLGENTLISPVGAADAEDLLAVQAARMAVIGYSDGSASTGTESVKLIYAPVAETVMVEEVETPDYDYLAIGDEEDAAYGLDGYKVADIASPVVNSFVSYNDIADVGSTIAIADLSTATSVDVTFRAWLEGEDAQAVNSAIGGVFNIALDIYGLTVSA
ncbi:MAG: hypothetical protein WC344_04905 [Bacilli bacterium]|jgi:hypothetical protein